MIGPDGKCDQPPLRKAQWGCEEPCTGRKVELTLSGETYTWDRCPKRLIHGTNVAAVLDAYSDREKGFLPEGPATSRNSATLMEAFRFIDREVARIQESERESKERREKMYREAGLRRG